MHTASAGKKAPRRSLPLSKELQESNAYSRVRIRKAMTKWRLMDEPATLLGRGLGRDELIGRVAREVGASLRQVRSAIKADRL